MFSKNPENHEQYLLIVELWEQGKTKAEIVILTALSPYIVQVCLNHYRSTKQSLQNNQPRREYAITSDTPNKPRRYTDEQLKNAVAESYSLARVLEKLGIRPAGGNYDVIKKHIRRLELDTSHFTGKGWSKGQKHTFVRQRDLEDILVIDSTYMSSHHLKNRLLAEGIFQHQCVSCNLTEWLERPIPLEIDHINGDRRDNRLENLRLLCPNCHALTETYRGRNKS